MSTVVPLRIIDRAEKVEPAPATVSECQVVVPLTAQ